MILELVIPASLRNWRGVRGPKYGGLCLEADVLPRGSHAHPAIRWITSCLRPRRCAAVPFPARLHRIAVGVRFGGLRPRNVHVSLTNDMNTGEPQDRNMRSTIAGSVVLTLLVIGALALVVPILAPPERQVVDTKLNNGTHLTFVFVAPTTIISETFVQAVTGARSAMRTRAMRDGLGFSTVGIADKWQVQEGLDLLAEFGTFDEVTVGRAWMNTGVQEYINTPRAPAKVPQLIIAVQAINMDTTPYVYGERHVLMRLIGSNEIEAWAGAKFPLRAIVPDRVPAPAVLPESSAAHRSSLTPVIR